MRKIFRKYREMSFEQRIVFNTILGFCFSAILLCGKFVIGLFGDRNLCTIAIYTFSLLLAKIECVKGTRENGRSFESHNRLISIFLFFSSAIYIGFMCRPLFIERQPAEHGIEYVAMISFIAFLELGMSITGIFRTKNSGHFYRDIKIINFCLALIAIMTAQMTILDFTSTADVDKFNAFAGIVIGVVIAVCAMYILIAPKISLTDRKNKAYLLTDQGKNKLADMKSDTFVLPLCKSKIYGSYYYTARIDGDKIDGSIELSSSLWKRMNIVCKIICCILSEILIFAWLIGRFIFFLRSANLPDRLDSKMKKNGFEKI